jgi:hypothetical protein
MYVFLVSFCVPEEQPGVQNMSFPIIGFRFGIWVFPSLDSGATRRLWSAHTMYVYLKVYLENRRIVCVYVFLVSFCVPEEQQGVCDPHISYVYLKVYLKNRRIACMCMCFWGPFCTWEATRRWWSAHIMYVYLNSTHSMYVCVFLVSFCVPQEQKGVRSMSLSIIGFRFGIWVYPALDSDSDSVTETHTFDILCRRVVLK